MGATNCPETPRQKMIGMMYLVLTAMLALNVSKDILNAFSIVDETLTSSTSITERTIASDEFLLDKQRLIMGEDKVADAVNKAASIKSSSDEMVKYIEQLKNDLLDHIEGTHTNEDGSPMAVSDIASKDNISGPTEFLINSGKAAELKKKLHDYRESLLALVDEKYRESVDKSIGIEVDNKYHDNDGLEESWDVHYFNGTIMAACVTLLNKTVGEVRNAESIVLKHTIGSITSEDFKFNQITGRAIPKSQVVFQGDKYTADIIVAAFDDKQSLEIYYKMGVDTLISTEGATKLEGLNGVGKLELPASGLGEQKYAGIIRMMAPDGTPRSYGFKDTYNVLKPTATVAAEKMNVFYAGIDNPVSVNAPCPPDKIHLQMSAGTATKIEAGKFNISVPASMQGKDVSVNITAEIGGKTTSFGATTFRVKKVPDPEAKVGGRIRGGKVSKSELTVNPFLTAKMDESFAYDLKWNIKSFRVTFVIKGVEDPPIACQGGKFSESVISKIKKAGVGTAIYITDIRASSPAGERNLNDISIRIR